MSETESSFVRVSPENWGLIAHVICPKITEREATIVEQEVSEAAGQHGWRVAVDMREVTFLASAGIGALVTVNRKAKDGGGAAVLCNVDDQILDVLKLTRLDRLFTIKPDVEGAAKALA